MPPTETDRELAERIKDLTGRFEEVSGQISEIRLDFGRRLSLAEKSSEDIRELTRGREEDRRAISDLRVVVTETRASMAEKFGEIFLAGKEQSTSLERQISALTLNVEKQISAMTLGVEKQISALTLNVEQQLGGLKLSVKESDGKLESFKSRVNVIFAIAAAVLAIFAIPVIRGSWDISSQVAEVRYTLKSQGEQISSQGKDISQALNELKRIDVTINRQSTQLADQSNRLRDVEKALWGPRGEGFEGLRKSPPEMVKEAPKRGTGSGAPRPDGNDDPPMPFTNPPIPMDTLPPRKPGDQAPPPAPDSAPPAPPPGSPSVPSSVPPPPIYPPTANKHPDVPPLSSV